MDWREEVLQARKEGKSWRQIGVIMQKYFPDENIEKIRQRARDYCRRQPDYIGRNVTPKVIEKKPKHIPVAQNFEPAETGDNGWRDGQTVKFAVVSDTHINSKYTQLSYLHEFYEECKRRGVKHVYHAGDISDGENMRVGHNYELYKIAADEQVDEICRVYPCVDGITTHFITGNHDASTMKHCGFDIGTAIASRRPDMEYLGRDTAIIHLTPKCTMQLLHPWDGGSYSISYRPQKIVEAMDGGTKPNILVIGHYHKALWMEYRNISVFMGGCFQGQTPFQRGKGLSRQMGGWIITAYTDKDGHITRITPEFIPFYVDISDDYKNFC